MFKKMTVLLIISILSALFFLSFAGCSKGETDIKETAADINAPAEDDTQEEQNATSIYDDELGEFDFGGKEFRITTWPPENTPWMTVIFDMEEETGDLVNDAIYSRNRKIEQRFNVKIRQIHRAGSFGDLQISATKSIKAGDDDSEVYIIVDRMALIMAQGGYCYSMSDVPYVDLDRPYWNKTLNDSISVRNKLYFAYGDYNLSTYDFTKVLLFSKQMVNDLNLENPYNLVNSGNWTFDAYDKIVKAASRDVDGTGPTSRDNYYGLLSAPQNPLPSFWISAGVQSISKNSEDIPEFTAIGDMKFQEIVAKVFEMTYDNSSWFRVKLEDSEGGANMRSIFESNRGLFFDSSFHSVSELRDMAVDFGIIPYPKYTENQENYYSRVEGGNPGIIPTTNSNLEMTGVLLEALASYSAKEVIPAYYEIALKLKYARDEESTAMLDLIFANRVYDLGDTYWCDFLRDGVLREMFNTDNRNLTSKLQSIERTLNKSIQKTIDAFDKID